MRNYYRMTISKKIKTIENKIKQNKAQYDLDRPTPKTSTLSSRYVNKCKFLNNQDVLPEKDLLEKAAIIKRFEYFLLENKLEAQTSIAKD